MKTQLDQIEIKKLAFRNRKGLFDENVYFAHDKAKDKNCMLTKCNKTDFYHLSY